MAKLVGKVEPRALSAAPMAKKDTRVARKVQLPHVVGTILVIVTRRANLGHNFARRLTKWHVFRSQKIHNLLRTHASPILTYKYTILIFFGTHIL
jgi:hypothetical protein